METIAFGLLMLFIAIGVAGLVATAAPPAGHIYGTALRHMFPGHYRNRSRDSRTVFRHTLAGLFLAGGAALITWIKSSSTISWLQLAMIASGAFAVVLMRLTESFKVTVPPDIARSYVRFLRSRFPGRYVPGRFETEQEFDERIANRHLSAIAFIPLLFAIAAFIWLEVNQGTPETPGR